MKYPQDKQKMIKSINEMLDEIQYMLNNTVEEFKNNEDNMYIIFNELEKRQYEMFKEE